MLSTASRVSFTLIFQNKNNRITLTLVEDINHILSYFICRDGCAMVESWDSEEPHNKNKGNSLCRNLFGKGNNIAKEQNPYPFKRVFKNEDYCVLKV